MGEYLEAILLKIGPRRRGIIIIILKITMLGYFLYIINHNTKLLNHRMLYTTITKTYVYLGKLDMIYGYVKVHIIEMIVVQN
jgi:hypothetical protein